MKRVKIQTLCIPLLCILIGLSQAAGNKKRAQTGIKFLQTSLDARLSAMGNASVAVELNSEAMFYNPSSMANTNNTIGLSFGQINWIADIKYQYGSLAYSPAGGRFGVFGLMFTSVDYGDFKGTIRSENEQGFLDTGIFNPSAFTVGLGYARSLTDRFSVGGSVKYVYEDLTGGAVDFNSRQGIGTEAFNTNVMAFDFGIMYKTGFRSLAFGMQVRNFSQELKYIQETFQLPLVFEIGVSMNMTDLTNLDPERHSLLLAVDATHPRDYSEQIDAGIEYTFLNTFSLRTGFTTPTDEAGMSFGAGFKKDLGSFGVAFDYAYTSFGIFDSVQRFSIKLSM